MWRCHWFRCILCCIISEWTNSAICATPYSSVHWGQGSEWMIRPSGETGTCARHVTTTSRGHMPSENCFPPLLSPRKIIAKGKTNKNYCTLILSGLCVPYVSPLYICICSLNFIIYYVQLARCEMHIKCWPESLKKKGALKDLSVTSKDNKTIQAMHV